MGLLGFLKKSKDMTANAGDTAGEMAGAFKGDLAMLQDVKDDAAVIEEATPDGSPPASENQDSEDSVVFLTFGNYAKDVWYCPECGTANDEAYNGCVVCGFQR